MASPPKCPVPLHPEGTWIGGAKGSRTPDLLIANETLYQLSYDPINFMMTSLEYRFRQSTFCFYAI